MKSIVIQTSGKKVVLANWLILVYTYIVVD